MLFTFIGLLLGGIALVTVIFTVIGGVQECKEDGFWGLSKEDFDKKYMKTKSVSL